MLIRSRLLESVPGIAHAFTTRRGGVSSEVFASANLSTRVGDERGKVEENRARLLTALGKGDSVLVLPKQVHGDLVIEVTRRASHLIEADALWTRDPGATVGVLTADCVPILLASACGRAVATVHAGWRGTALRIAETAARRLASEGFAASELRAAIGPGIGPCCFEVEADVGAELLAAYPEVEGASGEREGGKQVFDLPQLNYQALLAAGLLPENIEVLRSCTACESEHFFSHRRDHGACGRQGAFIAPALRG